MAAAPLDPRLLQGVDRSLSEVAAYQLAEGIWCLRLPLRIPAPRSVNAVLLDTPDGVILIDPGNLLGPGWPALEHGLALAGKCADDVTTLVCTHLHPDHAEIAPSFVERTGVPFLRGEGPDAATDLFRDIYTTLSRTERHSIARRAGVPAGDLHLMVDELLAKQGTVPRCRPTAELREGDALETSSGRWEAIPAKGHSPNQIVLYQPDRRWLIGADLAYAMGRPYIEWGHTSDPFGEFLDSLERVENLPIQLVIPGHGPPDSEPKLRFQAARERVLDWKRETVAQLNQGPASAFEVALGILHDDPDPNRRQSGLSSVLAVLDHLRACGRAEVDETSFVARWRLTT